MSCEIISPVNGSVYKTIQLINIEAANDAVVRAKKAGAEWATRPLESRIEAVAKFIDAFKADGEDIATELSWLLGRPRRYNFNEIRGFEERGRYLLSIAQDSLKDEIILPHKDGFTRYIKRVPVGVILVIAAWNYPYFVNSVIPALLAGNAVLLKHAPQTFPCADRLIKAARSAGIPHDVFQALHMDHGVAAGIMTHPFVNYIQFTGSVNGGLKVNQIASVKPINVGLELGGNDPAYVCPDANIAYSAENIVDGAMYNSGQSCCGIQRVYVHESVYDEFIAKVGSVTHQYKLGNPLEDGTTLGPVVSAQAAGQVREIIQDAVGKGATQLIDESQFTASKVGTAYVAPQVLLNVNHSMRIMSDEAFGPVMGIMKVSNEQEAIRWMNDSNYGLTASIWSTNPENAIRIGDQLETGTVFLNRCDYVDPSMPWGGVKNTGKGSSLSKYGFLEVTRPKNYHLRTAI